MPKVKLSSATKIKAIRKDLRSLQLYLMRNSIAKCAVAFLSREALFVEQHVATGKHQKGIEKRNSFCLVV